MEDSAQQAMDEWFALRSPDSDFRALNRLVMRRQHRLWRHACRIPRHETEAWEFIQEAWAGIIKYMRRLEDPVALPEFGSIRISQEILEQLSQLIHE